MPARVREALSKLELFVVSENVLSQRHGRKRRACPAAGRRLGREERHRHQFRAPDFAPAHFPAAAGRGQPDWWIVTQVAQRLGFGGASPITSAADVFREHAALSAFENDGTRDFDIGASAAI